MTYLVRSNHHCGLSDQCATNPAVPADDLCGLSSLEKTVKTLNLRCCFDHGKFAAFAVCGTAFDAIVGATPYATKDRPFSLPTATNIIPESLKSS
jgi:hypothetical protein